MENLANIVVVEVSFVQAKEYVESDVIFRNHVQKVMIDAYKHPYV